jgi:hypothetical protein
MLSGAAHAASDDGLDNDLAVDARSPGPSILNIFGGEQQGLPTHFFSCEIIPAENIALFARKSLREIISSQNGIESLRYCTTVAAGRNLEF